MGRPKNLKSRDENQFNVGIPRRLNDEATAFFANDESMDKKQHGAAMLHHYLFVANDDERLAMFTAFRKWLQNKAQADTPLPLSTEQAKAVRSPLEPAQPASRAKNKPVK